MMPLARASGGEDPKGGGHRDSGRRPRLGGILLALMAAVISGFSVFLNTYAVHHVHSATAFTAAKNLVAALVLLAATLLVMTTSRGRPPLPRRPGQWAMLAIIAVVGGSVPFVLFFEGAALTSATDAALIQKSLVVWVALLAVPLLGERLSPWHLGAIALLLGGQVLLLGPLTGDHANLGNLMILAATLLWSVETVLLKVALRSMPPFTVGLARLGLGVLLILGYLAVRGEVGALAALGAAGWEWALVMGAVLAAYVASWLGALARAPAVDVTAVLVGAAFVSAALDAGFRGYSLGSRLPGLVLIAAGVVLIALIAVRSRRLPARPL